MVFLSKDLHPRVGPPPLPEVWSFNQRKPSKGLVRCHFQRLTVGKTNIAGWKSLFRYETHLHFGEMSIAMLVYWRV